MICIATKHIILGKLELEGKIVIVGEIQDH